MSGVDDVARQKKVPKKAPKQAHEYTKNQRRRQESKRDHLRKMSVIFNSLARGRVHDVRRSFITGSIEQKLNREKDLPGCLFLPPIWEELLSVEQGCLRQFPSCVLCKEGILRF